jgi:F-box interacting protein
MEEDTTPPHIGDNTIVMEDISIGPLPEDADDATDPHIEDPAREGATARGNVVEERTLDTQNAIHPFPEAATDPHLEDPETSAREGATARDSVVEETTLDTSLNGEMIWTQLMPDAARSETNTIWAQIPDEVLIRVLSFLPLRMLFQMRVVCKRWSSMIRSSDFNRMCVDVQAPAVAPHPAICHVYNRLSFRWAIYSGSDRQWQLMPDFFHGRSEQDRMKKREVYVASRGLLCLLEVGDVDVIKSLTIWNPLTNHEQELPAFLSSWSFPLVRIMFHDARTNAYKLILAGNQNYHPEDERYSATEIYDSAHGAWIRGGKLLPSLRFPFSNGAICNGAVYYFASRPMTMYDILVVYDVDENEWSEINHVIPSNTYCTPYLFECDGNLLTVMHVLSGPPARIASCAIFHLDFRTKEWGMLIQMPHPVYMDFAYIGGCVASGKQLCVTGNAPNRDLIVAVYCPRNDAWFWLPPCPIAD